MSERFEITELANGFRISGSFTSVFLEYVKSATRKLDVLLVDRDGCISFDSDEIALKVLQEALCLARGQRQ